MKRRRGPSSVVLGSATTAVTAPSRPTSAPQHSWGYVSCPCCRMAAFTPGVILSASLIERPEAFVEVFLRAVGKHRDDDAAVDGPGDVEHRRDRRARRDAGEQPFLARQTPHHPVGAFGV